MKTLQFPGRRGAALALAVGLAAGGLGVAAAERYVGNNPPATFKLADPNEGPSRTGFGPVIRKVLPEVVSVSSSKVVKTPTSFDGGEIPPMFRQFFGDEGDVPQGNGRQRRAPRQQKEQGLGSGVIVSPEGYILTNNHVVDGATDVRVTLQDKREFKARVVGTDPKVDIAVLKIEGAGTLPAITISDSSKVQVGDYALAIGNPFGIGETVTMGIVSATGRANLGIEDYEDFIQTDAPINPGNSGGALVNDRGELIGINTAIIAHGSEGNQGIGFAVPVNLARQVMDQIVRYGKVTRAYMGIVPQDVTPAIAKAFHTDVRGALVGDVSPDSPAERAGVQKGDIITNVDGKPIEDANQLRMSISMMQPTATVRIGVLRDGRPQQLTVHLAEYPVKQERASAEQPNKEHAGLDGVSVEDLNPRTARDLGLSARTGGVVVTDVDPSSAAADAGLRRGDVIQEVNRKPVHSAQEFDAAVRRAGDQTLLLVNRGGNTLFVAV